MNGSTKMHIGIGAVVALISASITVAMTVGYFKARAETGISANTARVADNTAAIREQTRLFAETIKSHERKCDDVHIRLWQRMREDRTEQTNAYREITGTLGMINGKLELIQAKVNE